MSQLFKGEIINISDFNKKVGDLIDEIPIYYDENKIWYRWNKEGFRWEIIDDVDILVAVKEETNIANMSQNFIQSQIINALKVEARKRKPKPLRKTQIQFKNKIIDLTTGESMEATPEYFAFNPIDWELGNKEETPTIDKLLEEWVGKKEMQKLYEWIAYQIVPSYPIHRIMILNGGGSNGKSTFIELLRRFVGSRNFSAGDYESVFTRRFGTSILYKKLSLLMPEANFCKITDTATFKSATGDDTILVEFKNKSAFNFKNYAKVTISTNTLPVTLDKTNSFYRRILVVDFPNTFKEKFNLLEKIPKEEYCNLARKSINILKELLSKGEFNKEDTLEIKREKYERLSNPLSVFLEEKIIETQDMFITKKEFLNEANHWLKERNHRALTNKEVSQIMKDSYQEGWGTTLDENGGKRSERVWHGIYWKEKTPLIVQTEEIKA